MDFIFLLIKRKSWYVKDRTMNLGVMQTGLEPVMPTGFASYWLIKARNSLNVTFFLLFFFK